MGTHVETESRDKDIDRDAQSEGRLSVHSRDSTITREEIVQDFYEKQTWELWIIFISKLLVSLMFLIDDLTFLVFCQYEFGMT